MTQQKYKLLYATSAFEIEREVSSFLREGWRIAVLHPPFYSGQGFVQAVLFEREG